MLGGVVTTQYGILRSLILCGVLQSIGNLFFVLQAAEGHRIGYLALCVTAENITGGMAGTALITYISSLCSPGFTATATQYALLFLDYIARPQRGGLVRRMVVREDGLGNGSCVTGVVGVPAFVLFPGVIVAHTSAGSAQLNRRMAAPRHSTRPPR